LTNAALRLHVLGSSPSVPRPGRACSSYLLQSAGAAVLLDAGTGALSSLRTTFDYAKLGAVVISHMHADHFLDLVPLRYALTYGPSLRRAALPLWLPAGTAAALRTVASAFTGERRDDFLAAFDIREYDETSQVAIGDVELRFAPVRHYIEAFAIRAQTRSAALTYSGDSAPCAALVELARDSDLFVCEATLGAGGEPEPRGHSSAAEAGEMASAAGVRALALTHYPAEHPVDELRAKAAGTFAGPVCVLDDGMDLTVGGS
jgi:ribonuclease BN (tRNA processing enzyme)